LFNRVAQFLCLCFPLFSPKPDFPPPLTLIHLIFFNPFIGSCTIYPPTPFLRACPLSRVFSSRSSHLPLCCIFLLFLVHPVSLSPLFFFHFAFLRLILPALSPPLQTLEHTVLFSPPRLAPSFTHHFLLSQDPSLHIVPLSPEGLWHPLRVPSVPALSPGLFLLRRENNYPNLFAPLVRVFFWAPFFPPFSPPIVPSPFLSVFMLPPPFRHT